MDRSDVRQLQFTVVHILEEGNGASRWRPAVTDHCTARSPSTLARSPSSLATSPASTAHKVLACDNQVRRRKRRRSGGLGRWGGGGTGSKLWRWSHRQHFPHPRSSQPSHQPSRHPPRLARPAAQPSCHVYRQYKPDWSRPSSSASSSTPQWYQYFLPERRCHPHPAPPCPSSQAPPELSFCKYDLFVYGSRDMALHSVVFLLRGTSHGNN